MEPGWMELVLGWLAHALHQRKRHNDRSRPALLRRFNTPKMILAALSTKCLNYFIFFFNFFYLLLQGIEVLYAVFLRVSTRACLIVILRHVKS